MMRRTTVAYRAGIGVIAAAPLCAWAYPPYLTLWQQRYPTSTLPADMAALTGTSCNVCHHPPDRYYAGTCYREAIRTILDSGLEIEDALPMVEDLDSDGDGISNIDEILMPRLDTPGQVGYHPGLVGPLGTDPCSDFPDDIITGRIETPPGVCPADLNGDGLVDFSDYLEFLNRYEVEDPSVDFNRDGFVDFLDYLEFLNHYDAAC
ncbi:MAG: hypothetical protein IT436_16885 [Phycisphaerales bacterium]|nr:hypothetical protein [Phycisphaerales bacterium]